MFKLKRVLILLFMLFASITLAGCAIKGNFVGIVSATEFEFDETFMYTEVSNTTTTYSFIDQIVVSNEATWALYSDISATNEIVSKTIDLSVGNNFVYILVTRGRKTKLYTVTVKRLDAPAIDFEDDEINIEVGESITLNPILNDIDSIDLVNFTTLETDLISIDGALVTATAVGTATVTVTLSTDSNISDTITITITQSSSTILTALELSASDTFLGVGGSALLIVTPTPFIASNAVTWNSSDCSVATVSPTGLVSAVGVGVTTVTATSKLDTSITGTIKLYVNDVNGPGTITIEGDEDVKIGLTSQLSVSYENNYYSSLCWVSSKTSVAIVSETGLVTGLSVGTTVVRVTLGPTGEFSKDIIIRVITHPYPMISISGPNQVNKDSSITLTASANISGDILWESSDFNIAIVNNGQVYGIAAGAVTITAYFADNIYNRSSINITVIDPDAVGENPTSLTINATETVFARDTTSQLSVEGEYAVTWSSSITGIATVDSSGLVIGIGPGNVIITAALVADPNVKGTINLTVCLADGFLNVKVYQSSEVGGAIGIGLTTISKDLADSAIGYYQVYVYDFTGDIVNWVDCTYTSSNNGVCTVVSGLITAVSAGTTEISVTYEDIAGYVILTIVDDIN